MRLEIKATANKTSETVDCFTTNCNKCRNKSSKFTCNLQLDFANRMGESTLRKSWLRTKLTWVKNPIVKRCIAWDNIKNLKQIMIQYFKYKLKIIIIIINSEMYKYCY